MEVEESRGELSEMLIYEPAERECENEGEMEVRNVPRLRNRNNEGHRAP